MTIRRFTLLELGIWASLYPTYLAIRGTTIGDGHEAIRHGTSLVHLERATDLLHEADVQRAVHPVSAVFSTYYMVGFGPLIATVLIWLGLRAARSRRLKAFFVAHPFLMVVTVTATGNHYFVDAIGGATAALAAIVLLAGARRVRGNRSEPAGAQVIELPSAKRRRRTGDAA